MIQFQELKLSCQTTLVFLRTINLEEFHIPGIVLENVVFLSKF